MEKSLSFLLVVSVGDRFMAGRKTIVQRFIVGPVNFPQSRFITVSES